MGRSTRKHIASPRRNTRALGFVVIVPFVVAFVAVMARMAQRSVEVDLRDGRVSRPVETKSG